MTAQQASFTAMTNASAEDWAIIGSHYGEFAKGLTQRLVDHLKLLDGDFGGFPVDRLEHCLQTATRAHRDGRDEEYVVCALLHDIGDVYAPYNHDEFAASVIRPYVREQCTWVVAHHGLFQRYYYAHHFGGDREARKRHESHPFYEDAVLFCERWDQASFDPEYESLPLESFWPMVEAVFAREPYNPRVIATGRRMPLVDPAHAARRRAAV